MNRSISRYMYFKVDKRVPFGSAESGEYSHMVFLQWSSWFILTLEAVEHHTLHAQPTILVEARKNTYRQC